MNTTYNLNLDKNNLRKTNLYKRINISLFTVFGTVALFTGVMQSTMPTVTMTKVDQLSSDTIIRGLFYLTGIISFYFLYKFILEKQKAKKLIAQFKDHEKYNQMVEKQKLYNSIDFEKLHALSAHLLKALSQMIHDSSITLNKMQQTVDQIKANNTNFLANYYLQNVEQALPEDNADECLTPVDENGIPIN